MVKNLAINGSEKMGKLIGSIPGVLAVLLFLFAVSVALDFECDIASITGNGEVLGQSSVMVGDTLHKVYEVSVPLKLLDVVTLVLAVLGISRRKSILSGIRSASENNAQQWLLVVAGLFFLWAAVSILVHVQDYTGSQLVLMGLHLLKLLQVTFAGIIMSLLVREHDISEVSGPLLLGFLLADVLLILNRLGWIVIGTVAGDRMETFGSIIIAIAMIFHFHRVEAREGKISCFKQTLYVVTVFVVSVAVLTSSKRGVEIAYLVCIPLFVVSSLFSSKASSRKLQYALLAGFMVSLPNIVDDFQRTLGQPYNALHGTAHREEIVRTYEMFSSKSAPVANAGKVQERLRWKEKDFKVPFVSNLDYSGAERIGKLIQSIKLSPENLWVGSGFWGVQYKYGFLPDTGLQVLLETGLIGAALLMLMLYWIWHGAAKSRLFTNGPAAVHVLAVLVALVTLSVFCNPFYMSRLVMMWMFFSFLCIYPRVGARE